MKERHIEVGIAMLLKQALELGRFMGAAGVICPKDAPVMSDGEWADKKAKEFIASLE